MRPALAVGVGGAGVSTVNGTFWSSYLTVLVEVSGAERAWGRRRVDLHDIAGVDDILNQIDARAKELQQRNAAILAAETNR